MSGVVKSKEVGIEIKFGGYFFGLGIKLFVS